MIKSILIPILIVATLVAINLFFHAVFFVPQQEARSLTGIERKSLGGHVRRLDDEERGVTCYTYGNGSGISCVKTN